MSTHIYTREECKKLIDELEIIGGNFNTQIKLRKTKITVELKESILFHTIKCRDNLSERVYWILNDVEDYPFCQECSKQFQPRFFGLKNGYVGGRFCSPKCQTNNKDVQAAYRKTCLENHGYEYALQSPIIKEKGKQTNLKNLGVEYPSQSNISREKTKQTWLKTLGYDHPAKSAEIQEKRRLTCQEKYNVDHAWSSPIVREKCEQTCLERYGTKKISQSPIIKAKIEQTCLERYGYKCVFSSPLIKNKIKETNLKKLGYEYPGQSLKVQEKCRLTCQEKYNVDHVWSSPTVREKGQQTCKQIYNVDHPMKNIDIFLKCKNNARKKKKFISPSGKEITYQGYENVAFYELLNSGYLEERIITNNKFIPSFKYTFENKGRVYYPDLYIPHENLIIEVKSTWTYSKDLEQNLAKRQACIDAGYRFEFWICSDKEVLEIR